MTNHKSLLTLRSAVIILLGLLCGVSAGLLTAWSGTHIAQAALTGAASTAAGIAFFHLLIRQEP